VYAVEILSKGDVVFDGCLLDSLGPFLGDTTANESIHFRPQSDKTRYRGACSFIFHLAQDLFVPLTMQVVGVGVIGRVEQIEVSDTYPGKGPQFGFDT
jgi:hypothetical protein